MKHMKKVPAFLAGMLTMALVGSLGVGALAATGQLTITVDPVNIQVNGQTFAPTDEKGAAVPVFALDGTTYAPLRALAKAYGLEVGYDAAANMATVGPVSATPAPDTTLSTDYSTWTAEEELAYQEFKGLWDEERRVFDIGSNNSNRVTLSLLYSGSEDEKALSGRLNDNSMINWYTRLLTEYVDVSHPSALIVFYYDTAKPGTEMAIVELYNGSAVIVS